MAEAEGGTLLLENVERIGGEAAERLAAALDLAVDCRVVATSSASLDELSSLPGPIASRLTGFQTSLPPLQARRGDIGALIAAAIDAPLAIDEGVGWMLMQYDWPGNVRELVNTIRGAITLAGASAVRAEHLPEALRAAVREPQNAKR
jgi:transcriptional regulator of acetoin/glycerol metabolism